METKKVPGKAQKKNKKRTSKKGVPDNALIISEPTSCFDLSPVFSFLNVDSSKWKLSEWRGNELMDLIRCFQKMERRTWNELITSRGGLRIKKLKNPPIPDHISEDEKIYEVRVCQVKRIHGFIDKNVFNIIWFDRDHSVCAEGKKFSKG